MIYTVLNIKVLLRLKVSITLGGGIRLRNDLYCVEWGVKLYSLTHEFDLNQICLDWIECKL